MNNRVKRVIALALLLFCGFALVSPVFVFSADSRPTHNRYNIVLVVDASGSMSETDPSELRFEAIGKFVALLAERGNTIGTVVFSEDVVLERPVTDVNGIEVKKEIVDEIGKIKPQGYTNIGGALTAAITLLDKGENPELDSIILLLSDGNTDMPTPDEQTLSLAQKADAIERARASGYTIHSVSLNADGTASPDELSQISNATGGLFEEVTTADDLENVYDMFYRVVFNSLDYSKNLTEFPSSGVVEGTFKVPAIGVEEINLILSGLAEDYQLTDPTGKTHTKESLRRSTYSSDTFSVVKFTEPLPGEWSYAITGVPGDKIRIELIFNTNLTAHMEVSPPNQANQDAGYLLNDYIDITVSLLQAGERVRDDALYEGFTATVSINGVENEMRFLTAGIDFIPGTVFHYQLQPQESGAYVIEAKIEGWGHVLDAGSITIDVDNTPPVFNENIEHKVYLMPFSDNTAYIDLSTAATDPLGRELRYAVVSSAYNDNEYYIENLELVIHSYSLSKGSFEISALDPLGGSVSFNVYITTVNVTMWTLILLGGGGFIVLAVLGTIAWLNLNKRFYGICYVQFFNHESDEYYEEIVITAPKRGKRRLPARKLPNIGFNAGKCYFQASGKRHVSLKTNENVFGGGVKDKRFRIDGEGFPVQISRRLESTKGIIVRFESQKSGRRR
ncbi:MAG: VWA domain-containing protein [Oscillospiraceae bacterium]|nr:VWA domain-containing protein [Oscillospiraceae bacterium]